MISSTLKLKMKIVSDEHRSALRGTPRFRFAKAPNALSLELILLTLIEVALVSASWRVVLHYSQRNATYSLRLACCARGRVVLYRCRERPRNPLSPLRSALRSAC